MTAGSTSYREVNRARRSREIDRQGWAAVRSEVFAFQTSGSGQGWTEALVFEAAFEGRPSFRWGMVTNADVSQAIYAEAGVYDWQTYSSGEGRHFFYIAARVWVAIESVESHTVDWTFTFEGTALRNRTAIPTGSQEAFPVPTAEPPPGTVDPPSFPPATPEIPTFLKAHNTQVIVLLRVYPPHQTDVLLLQTVEISHQADLLVLHTTHLSHQVDALLEVAAPSRFHQTDVLLLATAELSQSVDMLLQAHLDASHEVDVFLVTRSVLAHSADVVIERIALTHGAEVLVSEEGVFSAAVTEPTLADHSTDLVVS